MNLIDSLATDYWFENTNRIYQENLHVSGLIMDAYKAGFEKAIKLSVTIAQENLNRIWDENDLRERGEIVIQIHNLLDKDDGNGPSLYDHVMAESVKIELINNTRSDD